MEIIHNETELTDAQRRLLVPDGIKTCYEPASNWLMVIPFPEKSRQGSIIIPNHHRKLLYEGHIVRLGPDVDKSKFGVGDCIVWDMNCEVRFETDDSQEKFCIVSPTDVLLIYPFEQILKDKTNG